VALEVELYAKLDMSGHIGLTKRPAKGQRIGGVGGRIAKDYPVEDIEELSSKLDIHRFPTNVSAFDD
jgi:hypothetical protein